MVTQSRILYSPREKKQAKRSFYRRIPRSVLFAILAAIACAGALILLNNPRWRVGAIEISGNETLTEDLVRKSISLSLAGNLAFIIPHDSLFFVRTRAIAENLKKMFPKIATADVQKEFPQTLRVAIRERTFWESFARGETAYPRLQMSFLPRQMARIIKNACT